MSSDDDCSGAVVRVIEEILSAENQYRSSLYKLLVNYKPVVNGNAKLASSALSSLFDILEDICSSTSELLMSLENSKHDCVQFAECLLEREKQILILYSDYCVTLPEASEVLSKLSSKDKLSAVLKQIQIEGGHELPLNAELLKPFQHLFVYEILLEKLHNATPSKTHTNNNNNDNNNDDNNNNGGEEEGGGGGGADRILKPESTKSPRQADRSRRSQSCAADTDDSREVVRLALGRIRSVLGRINELKRCRENRSRVKQLKGGSLKSFGGDIKLDKQGELLYEGIVFQRNKSVPRHLILFERSLLICKKYFGVLLCKRSLTTCGLAVKTSAYFNKCSVVGCHDSTADDKNEQDDEDNGQRTKGFLIFDEETQQRFAFQAMSVEQCRIWMKQLNIAITGSRRCVNGTRRTTIPWDCQHHSCSCVDEKQRQSNRKDSSSAAAVVVVVVEEEEEEDDKFRSRRRPGNKPSAVGHCHDCTGSVTTTTTADIAEATQHPDNGLVVQSEWMPRVKSSSTKDCAVVGAAAIGNYWAVSRLRQQRSLPRVSSMKRYGHFSDYRVAQHPDSETATTHNQKSRLWRTATSRNRTAAFDSSNPCQGIDGSPCCLARSTSHAIDHIRQRPSQLRESLTPTISRDQLHHHAHQQRTSQRSHNQIQPATA